MYTALYYCNNSNLVSIVLYCTPNSQSQPNPILFLRSYYAFPPITLQRLWRKGRATVHKSRQSHVTLRPAWTVVPIKVIGIHIQICILLVRYELMIHTIQYRYAENNLAFFMPSLPSTNSKPLFLQLHFMDSGLWNVNKPYFVFCTNYKFTVLLWRAEAQVMKLLLKCLWTCEQICFLDLGREGACQVSGTIGLGFWNQG
jgi:hypothetical protein